MFDILLVFLKDIKMKRNEISQQTTTKNKNKTISKNAKI